MKKIVIYFMLTLILVCGFNVKPVYANEYSVDLGDELLNEYFTIFKDVWSNSYAMDDSEVNVVYEDDTIVIDDGIVELNFSYSQGVLTLLAPSEIGSVYLMFALIEAYQEMYDYSNLVSYVYANLENDFTFENNGIEYNAYYDISEEEKDFMEDESNKGEWGWVVPPIVFDAFKLDIANELKGYDDDWLDIYEITDGTFSYDVTKNDVLKFVCDGPFDLFEAVYIDGKIVDEANYEVSEGSTIIEFKSEFAKKLSVGKHYVEFVYSDGNIVESTFEIIQTLENPKTSQNFGYKELALILGLLISGYIVLKKTKFRFN